MQDSAKTHTKISCFEKNQKFKLFDLTKHKFSQSESGADSSTIHPRNSWAELWTLCQGLMSHFPAPVSSFLLNSRVNWYMLLCRSLHQAIPILFFCGFFSIALRIIYTIMETWYPKSICKGVVCYLPLMPKFTLLDMLRCMKICFTNLSLSTYFCWILSPRTTTKQSIAAFISQGEKALVQNIFYVQNNQAYCLGSSDKNHRTGRKNPSLWQTSFKCNAPDEETCDTECLQKILSRK